MQSRPRRVSRSRRDDHLNGVLDALRRITQAIRLSSSVVQDTLGITGAQLFVLQQLADRPGASLRELADRTLTHQSSVSVVVSRLVTAGHVARRISPRDARRTELTLTDRGHAALRRAPVLAQTRLVEVLRDEPAARLGAVAAVLDRVARAISPASEPAPMFFEPPGKRTARAGHARTKAPPRDRGKLR
jgi:DNA-binding MarR family transcriptional regulator